jgi:gamma-glutamyltranspeptidase/glutathione hydrolase
MALRDGKPYLSFAVQGGDSQDQNLLQFFLNVHEFGMNVQQAAEAPNMNSFQMRSSFGGHESRPGRMLLAESMPDWVRAELRRWGTSSRSRSGRRGPSTPSSSTGSMARSGAAAAITARTTASRGSA